VGTFDVYDIRPRTMLEHDLQVFQDLVQLARKEILANDLHDAQVQLVKKLDVARREALMDPLTAVWNRRAADELLRKAIEIADADKNAMAVCMIDICRFKEINDTYGHPAGDAALTRIARLLVSSVRDGDAVCRVGGDEFMIIMPRVGPSEAEGVADRLRRAVEQTRLKTSGGDIALSVTTGIAIRAPGNRCTSDALVQSADRALYAARAPRSGSKGSGR
jgi:diguanylate cyclase (GGDEF)-like protein